MEVEKVKGDASEPPSTRRREDETKDTMDTSEIPIHQAEIEGDTDPNTAGSNFRVTEKRKSESGEGPPSTQKRFQALADSLHSITEGDKEGVQEKRTSTKLCHEGTSKMKKMWCGSTPSGL